MSGGGGLMQLVAYGAQDIYLTGEPQITFWKSVYRRHTNFAVESIIQTPNSVIFGSTTTVTITRSGDLLKKLWIEYSPYKLLSGVNENIVGSNIGHSLLEQMEIEIGGQIIDRQYGRWLTIWNYLTEQNPTGVQGTISTSSLGPGENDSSTLPDLSRPTRYNRMAYTHRGNLSVTDNSQAPNYAYIPLQFWFCKNPGLALPLIALQYHEVKLIMKIGNYSSITNGTETGIELIGFNVYADYVYLDTTERRQFAQNAHEYLIEQLQYNCANTDDLSILLNFNHPIKELIWTKPPVQLVSLQYPTGSSSPPDKLVPNKYRLVFNGKDRFTERDLTYFTRNQIWDCHTGFGSVLFPDSIAVYSFALRPEEQQPSGTCNFSRLDSTRLNRRNPENLDIYAINYNVLRIMSGMGGLAYSN
jgi:hypothetical protein